MSDDLLALARQAMQAEGFLQGFSAAVYAELEALPATASLLPGVADLRALPWSSIDNDTSRDLDQIEMAERLADGRIRVRVGIADVDAFVPSGSAIDAHAARQTTTIYAGVTTFPMLPPELSTGLTSLLENEDRLVLVTEFTVESDGRIAGSNVYRALARNHFQLTYSATGPWLETAATPVAKIEGSVVLQRQLRLQDEAARALRQARVARGALEFDRFENEAVVVNGEVIRLTAHRRNLASMLVEDFMLAANESMARLLRECGVSSLRRVVKAPERWDRIAAIAAERGSVLPARPDPLALSRFLQRQRQADAVRFPELSLAIMKLLGPGEYALELPGDNVPDHFSLAALHYTHSTAPNRRYSDVVTQRIVKAALAGAPAPYSDEELALIAEHCTLQEDAARQVERLMEKRMAAQALANRVGDSFAAIVTGVKAKGTFVRVLDPPLEGKVMERDPGVEVGDRIEVRLRAVDVPKGFIDFSLLPA